MDLENLFFIILILIYNLGKSKTICEAIKQAWKQSPDNFIIVTAHSNSAVDLLVKELISVPGLDVPKKNICRITSKNWFETSMSQQIRKFSTTDARDVLRMKDLRILCGTLQILGNPKLPFRRATHIFVDEAGQSPEPDILIPWTLYDPDLEGQVVLAGDPHRK